MWDVSWTTWGGRSDKLLLGFASTVILGSESRGTRDHIFMSHDSGIVCSLHVGAAIMYSFLLQLFSKS
jgi:hypothetical protein